MKLRVFLCKYYRELYLLCVSMYTTVYSVYTSIRSEVQPTDIHTGRGNIVCERLCDNFRTHCTMDDPDYCGRIRRSTLEDSSRTLRSRRNRVFDPLRSGPRPPTARRGRRRVSATVTSHAEARCESVSTSTQTAETSEESKVLPAIVEEPGPEDTVPEPELPVFKQEPQSEENIPELEDGAEQAPLVRIPGLILYAEEPGPEAAGPEPELPEFKQETQFDFNLALSAGPEEVEMSQLLTYWDLRTQVRGLLELKAQRRGLTWDSTWDEVQRTILSEARKWYGQVFDRPYFPMTYLCERFELSEIRLYYEQQASIINSAYAPSSPESEESNCWVGSSSPSTTDSSDMRKKEQSKVEDAIYKEMRREHLMNESYMFFPFPKTEGREKSIAESADLQLRLTLLPNIERSAKRLGALSLLIREQHDVAVSMNVQFAQPSDLVIGTIREFGVGYYIHTTELADEFIALSQEEKIFQALININRERENQALNGEVVNMIVIHPRHEERILSSTDDPIEIEDFPTSRFFKVPRSTKSDEILSHMRRERYGDNHGSGDSSRKPKSDHAPKPNRRGKENPIYKRCSQPDRTKMAKRLNRAVNWLSTPMATCLLMAMFTLAIGVPLGAPGKDLLSPPPTSNAHIQRTIVSFHQDTKNMAWWNKLVNNQSSLKVKRTKRQHTFTEDELMCAIRKEIRPECVKSAQSVSELIENMEAHAGAPISMESTDPHSVIVGNNTSNKMPLGKLLYRAVPTVWFCCEVENILLVVNNNIECNERQEEEAVLRKHCVTILTKRLVSLNLVTGKINNSTESKDVAARVLPGRPEFILPGLTRADTAAKTRTNQESIEDTIEDPFIQPTDSVPTHPKVQEMTATATSLAPMEEFLKESAATMRMLCIAIPFSVAAIIIVTCLWEARRYHEERRQRRHEEAQLQDIINRQRFGTRQFQESYNNLFQL